MTSTTVENKGPAIGAACVPDCRQRMNSGVITSSELPETEGLAEEPRETGLGGSPKSRVTQLIEERSGIRTIGSGGNPMGDLSPGNAGRSKEMGGEQCIDAQWKGNTTAKKAQFKSTASSLDVG